jgi:hypothetical protein
MIFGSLGLLVIGAGLLVAGITKGSTGYLALSFAASAAGGLLLLLAYASARGVTGMSTLARAGHVDGVPGAPGGPPVVMYVPVAPEVLAQLTPPPVANGGSHESDRAGNGHTAPNEVASGVAVAVEVAPVVGYDDMTAEQVVKLIASGAMTEAQLEAVRDYEAAHDARKTVLDRLAKML